MVDLKKKFLKEIIGGAKLVILKKIYVFIIKTVKVTQQKQKIETIN